MSPIKVKEILIQGKKGRFKSTSPEGDCLFNSKEMPHAHVNQIMDLIQSIATHANSKHTPEEITRAITDEFSFYPERPLTLDEYKEIIDRTASIANTLSPDVHLVLATFPVLWPNGAINNCGLYVEAPKNQNQQSIIHHFSKKNPHPSDCSYSDENKKYGLSSDEYCTPEQLPQVVLSNTRAKINHHNQFGSALKLNTSKGDAFIVSLGICYDHELGVEREQVHGLIEQLAQHEESIPLHCSHIITSSSIGEKSENILSTLSHADPNPNYRLSNDVPGRMGYTTGVITSSFSGQLTTETYPSKFIGVLHSDLLQHILANQAMDLNVRNEQGETLLHEALHEMNGDREIIAKRLYSLIVNGADPLITNHAGQSVIDLASQIEQDSEDKILVPAIDAALSWQKQVSSINKISPIDGQTELTRQAKKDNPSSLPLTALIESGANPYLKNREGQNFLELAQKSNKKTQLLTSIPPIQYGFKRENTLSKDNIWFRPYLPKDFATLKNWLPQYSSIIDKIEEKLPKFIKNIKNLQQSPANATSLVAVLKEAQQLAANLNNVDTIIEELVKSILKQNFSQAPDDFTMKVNLFLGQTVVNASHFSFSLIQSISDLTVLKFLPAESQNIFFLKEKTRISSMIQNARDLIVALDSLSVNHRTILLNDLRPQLPALINTAKEVNDLFLSRKNVWVRTSPLREILFEALTEKISQLKNIEDLMLENFKPAERQVLINQLFMQAANVEESMVLMEQFDANEMQFFLCELDEEKFYSIFTHPEIDNCIFCCRESFTANNIPSMLNHFNQTQRQIFSEMLIRNHMIEDPRAITQSFKEQLLQEKTKDLDLMDENLNQSKLSH